MTAVLEARLAERRFRGGAGVGPLDLTLAAGEVVALMGPNGSGKSTLLRVLATADRTRGGSVTWWGCDRRPVARRRIGYAPDQAVDEDALSARQSTHFWCRQWLRGEEARRRTDRVLAELGIAAIADEPLGNLSFGTRRRVGLAQSLVHEPELVLMDEPSAGIDPDGVDDLVGLLRTRASAGAAAVVASNDPGFVGRVADRVAFLDGGLLIRVEATGRLLAELPSRVVELRRRDERWDGPNIAGARTLGCSDGWWTVELMDDTSLPALVAAADWPGGRLEGLHLRSPDLRDCFRRLTGREMTAGAPR
ncbi:MAG: ATP-binding cassette domain-containing protein [Candidatus Dormibacteria bacterium]